MWGAGQFVVLHTRGVLLKYLFIWYSLIFFNS